MNHDDIDFLKLEKYDTKDVKDQHVNGSLTLVWRDYDQLLKFEPKMVYVTSANPGETKGPHLHKVRHSYFVCIRGKVIFVAKNKEGKYVEIESSEENPVLVEIPKNHSSAHINLSSEPSIIMALVNPSWKPDNRDEHNVTYDDYDWSKWDVYLS